MGNSIAGMTKRRRSARVMTVDGATYKYRPPASAGDALRDHPGHHHLLESDEVRRLGVRARPLDPDAPLKPGKLYFLVDLPRLSRRPPQRTWSGALHYGGGGSSGAGAGERLESMMLARRSASDVAASVLASPSALSSVEAVGDGGAVRLRVRLPKADVQRLVKESRDAADAAEKIMQLCVARDQQRQYRSAPGTPVVVPVPAPLPTPLLPAITTSSSMSSARKDFGSSKPAASSGAKKEKRARFVTVPDEIIGF